MFNKEWLAHRLEIKHPNLSVKQRNKLWNIRRFFMMTFVVIYVMYMQIYDAWEVSNKVLLIHAVCFAFGMKLIMYTVEQMFNDEPKSLND